MLAAPECATDVSLAIVANDVTGDQLQGTPEQSCSKPGFGATFELWAAPATSPTSAAAMTAAIPIRRPDPIRAAPRARIIAPPHCQRRSEHSRFKRFSSRVGGERRVDADAAGAEVDECDEGVGAVEAVAAVADQAHFRVEAFEAAVGEAEADGGEDAVSVLAERAGELDERFQLAA